jgi:uncharacterized protein YqgC (DUF456 family)
VVVRRFLLVLCINSVLFPWIPGVKLCFPGFLVYTACVVRSEGSL